LGAESGPAGRHVRVALGSSCQAHRLAAHAAAALSVGGEGAGDEDVGVGSRGPQADLRQGSLPAVSASDRRALSRHIAFLLRCGTGSRSLGRRPRLCRRGVGRGRCEGRAGGGVVFCGGAGVGGAGGEGCTEAVDKGVLHGPGPCQLCFRVVAHLRTRRLRFDPSQSCVLRWRLLTRVAAH
jgi:hypothetical protein